MIILLGLFFVAFCQVYGGYEGDYQPGVQQVGFDEENFQGDYSEDVTSINDILEEMENEFVNQADLSKGLVNDAFDNKKNQHDNVVAKENAYNAALTARIASESAYNIARQAEETAHDELMGAIVLYDNSVTEYGNEHAAHISEIDFLNYELFIIHQIRELLGPKIGFTPEQIVIDALEYDSTYDGWTTQYPDIHLSSFDHGTQRFPGAKKRRRRRRKRKRR